jgi:hypothetical protein
MFRQVLCVGAHSEMIRKILHELQFARHAMYRERVIDCGMHHAWYDINAAE